VSNRHQIERRSEKRRGEGSDERWGKSAPLIFNRQQTEAEGAGTVALISQLEQAIFFRACLKHVSLSDSIEMANVRLD
jgi:hypothetical protein